MITATEYVSLDSVRIPIHFPKRQRRINGDTRRRKTRIRKKLEKQDIIKYGPIIRKQYEEMKSAAQNQIIDNAMLACNKPIWLQSGSLSGTWRNHAR